MLSADYANGECEFVMAKKVDLAGTAHNSFLYNIYMDEQGVSRIYPHICAYDREKDKTNARRSL